MPDTPTQNTGAETTSGPPDAPLTAPHAASSSTGSPTPKFGDPGTFDNSDETQWKFVEFWRSHLQATLEKILDNALSRGKYELLPFCTRHDRGVRVLVDKDQKLTLTAKRGVQNVVKNQLRGLFGDEVSISVDKKKGGFIREALTRGGMRDLY
jgi:hypothetical protein